MVRMSERSKMQVCMYSMYECVYFQQFIPCHVATSWWQRDGYNSRRCARRWEWGSCQRSFDMSGPQQLHPPLPPPSKPPYRRNRNKWMWRRPPSRSPWLRSQSMSLRGGRHCITGVGTASIAPKKSRAGMDSHIRAMHTKKALQCSFCAFSTYNFDSLQRHEKEHK